MKYTEIKAMSDDELAKKLEEGRAELFNLRFQMATSQLDNTTTRLASRPSRRTSRASSPSSAPVRSPRRSPPRRTRSQENDYG